jgi:polyhydroxyalkanoate synthesis regulator phasin
MARVLTMALVWGLETSIAAAQNPASSVPLGDLARQLKAQRAKSQGKSKVFTNDDLATLSPPPSKPSATTQEAKPGEKPAKETSGNEIEKESAKATPAKAGEETHGEKYYRDRMSKLQDRLEIDQRELSVLQEKLGQSQMMYYADPNKGLLQRSGPTAMSDVYTLQDQIAKKKAEIAADQEAIEDLREQLRREGGDAGWLR